MKTAWLPAACLLCATAAAQTPIRVDVQLINVAFAVWNPDGTFATNLSQDDFEVFEDGAAQKISFFARASDVDLRLGLVVDFSGSQERERPGIPIGVRRILSTRRWDENAGLLQRDALSSQ